MAIVPKLLKLNSGFEIPQLGLGTWLSNEGEVQRAVKDAIDVGYRHIDCATAYGNQTEVGSAFDHIFSSGKIRREDVFITSKIWNTYHSYQEASENVDVILQDLKIPYLDMCLIHWPMGYLEGGPIFPFDAHGKMRYQNTHFMDTWKAMEDAVNAGKIRSVGVSNFNSKQIQRIIDEGTIHPSNVQVEIHPYFSQEKLIEFCQQKGIVVTAFSPLANPAHKFRKEGQPNLLTETDIIAIGETHKKTPAQVCIRWAIQRGVVVIPKSVSRHRIEENFDVSNFELSLDEMEQISNMNRNWRILDLTRDLEHKDYPFLEEF